MLIWGQLGYKGDTRTIYSDHGFAGSGPYAWLASAKLTVGVPSTVSELAVSGYAQAGDADSDGENR